VNDIQNHIPSIKVSPHTGTHPIAKTYQGKLNPNHPSLQLIMKKIKPAHNREHG